MYVNTLSVVIAVFMLVPSVLSGQQVNTRVDSIDLRVNARVQDPDQPQSALLPGGSSAWTGQPIMSETPFSGTSGPAQRPGAMGKTSQSPSLVGVSVWGPSSIAATPSSDISGGQEHTQTVKRWTKAGSSRKLSVMMATAELQSARSGHLQDELSVEQNVPSDSNLKLRKLKRAATRLGRLRIANSFQPKADGYVARWGHDTLGASFSASAMAKKQHESGLLLRYGFNARREREARRKHKYRVSGSNSATR
jgi:hypothetical protein